MGKTETYFTLWEFQVRRSDSMECLTLRNSMMILDFNFHLCHNDIEFFVFTGGVMKKILASLFISIFLFCGCADNPAVEQPMELVYHLQEVVYSEEYGLRIIMECTETELGRYSFDPSIDPSVRSQCIEATDRILAGQTALDVRPEIFVFTEATYPEASVEENRLYLPIQDWQTVSYATHVLLAAYGQYSHYGLAYGYANLLCNDSVPENPFPVSSVSDVGDLNLLCFDEQFVSEQDVVTAKGLACHFARMYVEDNGEAQLQELLSSSGTEAGALQVSNALEQYYRDNGLDYVPSSLRFGYGDQSYDYTILDALAAFYVHKNWRDANAQGNPLVYEGFLHQNYSDIKTFILTNLEQMRQYREFFALENYKPGLRIYFVDSELSQFSFYRSDRHAIYLQNVDSLMHEYIHALTQPTSSMDAWEVEGFARYFSYRYDHYGMAFLNQDYNNLPETSKTKYVYEYLAGIGRPIDMATDFEELENIAVWFWGFQDPNAEYAAGSSFVQYLVKQYGERAVIDSIYANQSPLPKPYEELVSDWLAYIENQCQGYSKFEKQKPGIKH